MVEENDHDILIELRAQVGELSRTVHNQGENSTARDTRIETKVDRINGQVREHQAQIASHALIPHDGVTKEESRGHIDKLNELWTAWGIGKWVGATLVLTLLGQTVALIALVIENS